MNIFILVLWSLVGISMSYSPARIHHSDHAQIFQETPDMQTLKIYTQINASLIDASQITQVLAVSSPVNQSHIRVKYKVCVWRSDEPVQIYLLPLSRLTGTAQSLFEGLSMNSQEIIPNYTPETSRLGDFMTSPSPTPMKPHPLYLNLMTEIKPSNTKTTSLQEQQNLLKRNRKNVISQYTKEIRDLANFPRNSEIIDPMMIGRRRRDIESEESLDNLAARRNRLVNFRAALQARLNALNALVHLTGNDPIRDCQYALVPQKLISCLYQLGMLDPDEEILELVYSISSHLMSDSILRNIELNDYKLILQRESK
uniref:PP3 n=1 Tax=Drosophila immigrans sigmavirus TaxID=1002360 RepID=A0A140D8L9_9RHAB|nr:PP3 [Drosophila immigrans sigmavirus]